MKIKNGPAFRAKGRPSRTAARCSAERQRDATRGRPERVQLVATRQPSFGMRRLGVVWSAHPGSDLDRTTRIREPSGDGGCGVAVGRLNRFPDGSAGDDR